MSAFFYSGFISGVQILDQVNLVIYTKFKNRFILQKKIRPKFRQFDSVHINTTNFSHMPFGGQALLMDGTWGIRTLTNMVKFPMVKS